MNNEIQHHGIKGMRWGVRRYRNEDGSLTAAGRKRAAKLAKKDEIKSAVKNYRKEYNNWEKAQGSADKKWKAAQKQYMSLGKIGLTRIINAAKGNTPEAKKYSKMYNEWSKAQGLADKQWRSVSKAYAKTGKTRVSAIINNIKYGG